MRGLVKRWGRVLGADAHADEAAQKLAQWPEARNYSEWERNRWWSLIFEQRREHPILDQHLSILNPSCRQLSPLLDLFEHVMADGAIANGSREDVGGCDRILDREIDAHASDW